MASTQIIRADVGAFLPLTFIVLMMLLPLLGFVAHVAAAEERQSPGLPQRQTGAR